LKYEYLFPLKDKSRIGKCLICGKRKCNSIDNVGTICHWECLGFPEAPE